MFQNIYVESEVLAQPYTQNILKFFKDIPSTEIRAIEDHFGKVKKPYLHKRTDLNLFLGKKRGQLIKETPDAYGTQTGKHYYFIHAYNCVYECEYCFLQGYFHSPDIVLFTNHDEIIQEMKSLIDGETWFHAGEFSDSLALSHITNEWAQYFDFFKENPEAKLELRSKSSNIKPLLELEPLQNVIITFSLADEENSKKYDRKTPPLKARLKAIKQLVDKGFRIGIHLDPIVYSENLIERYSSMISELKEVLPNESLEYISIGVVRYTKDVYRQVEKNYPDSDITKQPLQKSFDDKVRYSRPLRGWILSNIEKLLESASYNVSKIYRCME